MSIDLRKTFGTDMELKSELPIYVFGTGQFGRDVARSFLSIGFDVAGFISNTETLPVLNLIKVFRWEDLTDTENMQILIAILNPNDPLSFFTEQAKVCGARNIFLPWDFYRYIEKDMGWRFWLKDKEFLFSHKEYVDRVLPKLSDDLSRECLKGVFEFRTGNFINYGCFNHKEPHYFNQITLSSKNEISGYLDIGAFHGENLSELEAHLPVRMAILLEPDRKNFQELMKKIDHFTTKHLFPMPVGAYEKTGFLKFNSYGSESSGISEDGETQVLCVKLDDIVPFSEEIDFIKIDVEGLELAVLKGAKRVINKSRPVLAISLYHNWDDIWTIPNYVLDNHRGYDLFVRQHMNNSFELVLYAVPR